MPNILEKQTPFNRTFHSQFCLHVLAIIGLLSGLLFFCEIISPLFSLNEKSRGFKLILGIVYIAVMLFSMYLVPVLAILIFNRAIDQFVGFIDRTVTTPQALQAGYEWTLLRLQSLIEGSKRRPYLGNVHLFLPSMFAAFLAIDLISSKTNLEDGSAYLLFVSMSVFITATYALFLTVTLVAALLIGISMGKS